ncbi:DMT family transporter [Lysinibacillus agricola]|uniref:DMT family transporter n=1 Tax=Lysinibacillus agricola TaxID=2590012 RepID=A0ABX7AZ43_9BACI|nr:MULTISPECIES: DMT family transporter [Lysinibacillus]QQP14118.1 DMT family transporter [Lysinibacillus agricola]
MELTLQRKHNLHAIGVLSLILSAILTSVSQVYYANRVQAVHPFLFTGISFFITTLYFQFFSIKQQSSMKWNKAATPILLKLNSASVLAFMGFYFALKYIEPAIVSSLEMGLGPLFVILLAIKQKHHINVAKVSIAIGTLVACLILIYAIFAGKSALITWSKFSLLGILASIICGLGAVLCTLYSKQLSELGWTSSMILSKRFYGIILLSLIATYDVILDYLIGNIGWILLMTLLGVLVPMYLLQKGIQYCTPFFVMMSLCFIPVFTFFFQLFDTRLQWSNITFLGVVLLLLLGISSVIVDRNE